MIPTTWQVFSAGLLPVIFTGLGVLPLALVRNLNGRVMGLANALAAGLMLGASLSLMAEGFHHGGYRLLAGFVLGVILVWQVRRKLSHHEHLTFHNINRRDTAKMLLIVGVMTAHSFAEGVGVGMSYGHGAALGTMIALAIAIHKIPEGLAIGLVLVPRKTPVWKAVLWSMFTSLPLPLMSVLAYSAVRLFDPLLPLGLGLAAGGMATLVFTELLPEARQVVAQRTVYATAAAAAIGMLVFQIAFM